MYCIIPEYSLCVRIDTYYKVCTGQNDEGAINALAKQARQPAFDPPHPHKGERRELTLHSCPLMLCLCHTQHMLDSYTIRTTTSTVNGMTCNK